MNAKDEISAYFAKLNKAFYEALKKIEKYFNLRADEKILKRLFGEALHVFIHEAIHVFMRASVPWLDALDDAERELLDEVFSRLVERAISEELREELGLEEIVVEGFDEQLAELRFYPHLRGLQISVDEYSKLYSILVGRLRQGEPIESLAKWLLDICRELLHEGRGPQS